MNDKVGVNSPCPCGSGKKFKKCHKGTIAARKGKKFAVSVKEGGKSYEINKKWNMVL